MATIKDILTSAYRYSGILNDVVELDGNRSKEALAFLNQIIYRYNLENYLPFCQNVKTLPAGFQTYEFFVGEDDPPAPQETFGGNAMIIDELPPVSMLQVSYKNGLHWSPIDICGFGAITPYILNVAAVPSLATYQRTDNAGFLYLNRPSTRDIRLVYNKMLKNVEQDDVLDAPGEYVQLFTITLAIRLARKYKLPTTDIEVLVAEKDDILNNIQDRNKNDHHFYYTEEDINPYYNILSPRNW